MLKNAIVFLLFLIVCSGANAQTMDCVVQDPNPPLNVRDESDNYHKGSIIGTVNNGTRVFPVPSAFSGLHERWILTYEVVDGAAKKLGYVFRDFLVCNERDKTGRYPILIESASKGSADLRMFGIDHSNYFPNQCFYYGDGGYTLSISNDFKARYDRMGMPFENLCFVLRTGLMRYDPESGKRLPTYMVGKIDLVARLFRKPEAQDDQPHSDEETLNSGDVSEELPLEVPKCFAGAKHTDRSALDVSSCSFRYHPWSGKLLNPDEAKVFASAGFYIEGGAGPGTSPDAAKLTLDSRRRLSSAQIEAEAKALSK
jgi:hypothetical protein